MIKKTLYAINKKIKIFSYKQIIMFAFTLICFSFAVITLAFIFANVIIIKTFKISDIKDIILSLTPILAIFMTLKNEENNLKSKKELHLLENYETKKREVLENFINASVERFNNATNENITHFTKSFYILRIYFKSINSDFFNEINELFKNIENGNYTKKIEETKILFFKTIQKLESEVEKY